MDALLNKLFPKAKCEGTSGGADIIEDPFLPHMDEEQMLTGGTGDSFKSALEYRNIANRNTIFSTAQEKVEGFRFSFTTPLSTAFMLQSKWQLYPPQNASHQNPMMAMMAPPKSSNFEMDIYYIHGVPTDQTQMMSGSFDQSRLTHFRGGLKFGGIVEAMIMKKLNSWLDMRFEGQFMTPAQSQWNLTFVSSNRLNVNSFSYGNMNYGFSSSHLLGRHLMAGFELFYLCFLTKPQNQMIDMSLCGLYKRGNKTVDLSLDKMRQQFALTFTSKIDKSTQIGSRFSYEMMEGESQASLAYQKNFNKSLIKAIVDSTGKVQTCFTLGDTMSMLKFRTFASGNIFTESYKFGYAVHIGMEEL